MKDNNSSNAMLDALPALVLKFDQDSLCTYANKKCPQWLGIEKNKIIGAHLRTIIGDLSWAESQEHIDNLLQGSPGNIEFEYQHPKGTTHWFSIYAAPDFDTKGSVVGYQILATDISDTKINQQVLEKITQHISSVTGERFFTHLVSSLVDTLDVSFALVAEVANDKATHVKTLAVWFRNHQARHIQYKIQHSPYKQVLEGELICIPEDLQYIYPKDAFIKQFGLHGFCGTPLINAQGKILGLLCIMGHSNLSNPGLVSSTLKILGGRATAELERLESERNLEHSEQKFRGLMEHLPKLATQGYDKERRVTFWNKASENLYGYTADEAMGQRLEELIAPPSMRQPVISAIADWFDKGIPIPSSELQLQTKSGMPASVFSSHAMLRNIKGEKEMFCVDVDLRQLKIAEKAQKTSEQEFKNILNNMEETFFRTNIHGKLMLMSKSAAKLTGWTAEELVGRNVARLYAGPKTIRHFLRLLASNKGSLIDFQFMLRHKNGHNRWITANTHYHYTAEGKLSGVEGTLLDITEQKKMRDTQRRMIEILEATPDFVGTADKHHNILYLNKGARSMLGLEEGADVSQMKLSDIYPLSAYEQLAFNALPHAIWRNTWSGESALSTVDDREIPVWQTLVVHHAGNGKIDYLSFIMKDITAHKQKEEQVGHDQKMKILGQLTSGIAHDFGNMLTIVKGNLGILEEMLTPVSDPEIAELLEDALSATEDGTRITQQLRLFSRKKSTLSTQENINDIIHKLSRLLSRPLGKKIKLELKLTPDIEDIMVNRSQLESALLNLVFNARDAMPEGGTIIIASKRWIIDTTENSSYAGLSPGAYIRLVIEDSGVGMDKFMLENACKPFFTTKPEGEGTGLGLNLTFTLMQELGGLLQLHSVPGMGTTAELLFPAIAGTSHADTKTDMLSSADSITVLVVEDKPAVRRYSCHALQKLGFSTLEADNAASAQLILNDQHQSINILFSDILMPGKMNGRKLAVWTQDNFPSITILLTTAAEAETDDDSSTEDIIFPVLKKPYTPEELSTAIQRIRQV